jgi:hypothetical protein
MPRVCLHYRFLRHRGEEETRTCLVCRAEGSKVTFADACPKKGACEYSVSQSLSNIKRLGRNNLVIQSGQEPAIIAVANDIKAQRAEETLLEFSKVVGSHSSGTADKAIQQVGEQVRVIK